MTADDDIAQWDAAYVLGALSADDRKAYERFLADNPDRAAALDDIAGLPDILDALTADEVLALELPRLADRRRSRWLPVLAAAAAFLAVGVLVGSAIFPRTVEVPGPAIAAPALQPMTEVGRGGVTASLAVTPMSWGTRLDWQCQYVKGWAKTVSNYDLVVTTADGKEHTVASWAPGDKDRAESLAAATSIPAADIRVVDIRAAPSPEPLAVKRFT